MILRGTISFHKYIFSNFYKTFCILFENQIENIFVSNYRCDIENGVKDKCELKPERAITLLPRKRFLE